MTFREARITDIKGIQEVRHSVKENVLSDPALVTDQDCEVYLTKRGKGWVCVLDEAIVGFSIADLKEHNIWALFVRPDYEGKGIGKGLHDLMLHWYFHQTQETVWLGTAPNTRAEKFYKIAGWNEVGRRENGEVKFEMTYADWNKLPDR